MMNAVVEKIIDKETIRVMVVETKIHPLYKKVVKKKKFFLCQANRDIDVEVGSNVEIASSRPISKRKHFVVVKLVK